MTRWLLRAVVSATAVAVLLRIIPLQDILRALARVNVWTWVMSVAIFFAGHYSNAVKLRLLLGAPEAPLSDCVRAQYAGLVANLGLPGIAGGDFVRAAYLAPTLGARRVAFAGVADRVIDTVTLAALAVIALPLAGVPPGLEAIVARVVWWIVGGVVASVIAAIIAVGLRRYRPSLGLRTLVGARPSAVVGAVAISLLVQTMFVLTNVWLARQLGVTVGLAPWFVAWPLSKLIAVLPISIGGFGVREAALVSLLTPYGAPRDAALASGLLWQAILAVTGLVGLLVTQMVPKSAPTAAAIDSPPAGA